MAARLLPAVGALTPAALGRALGAGQTGIGRLEISGVPALSYDADRRVRLGAVESFVVALDVGTFAETGLQLYLGIGYPR